MLLECEHHMPPPSDCKAPCEGAPPSEVPCHLLPLHPQDMCGPRPRVTLLQESLVGVSWPLLCGVEAWVQIWLVSGYP